MQKFGLDEQLNRGMVGIELEIMGEQAVALGHAGRKLKQCIEIYQRSLQKPVGHADDDKLLKDIANAAWELLLQREFVGFVHDNVKWLKASYGVPEEAFKYFGSGK